MNERWHRLGLLILVLAGAMAVALWIRRPGTNAVPARPPGADQEELIRRFLDLEAAELEADRTVWARERLAQRYGQVLDRLWDGINAATNKLGVAAAFSLGQIQLAQFGPARDGPAGIQWRQTEGPRSSWTRDQWSRLLAAQHRAGWEIAQLEIRQVGFTPPTESLAARSEFWFSAHLTNSGRGERAALEGTAWVEWNEAGDAEPKPVRTEIEHLTLKTRAGAPPFEAVLEETIAPIAGSFFIDPLIVYDLDGDGTFEIILAARNLVYRWAPLPRGGEGENKGVLGSPRSGRYESRPLCRHSPGLIFTAVIADFDRDGAADLLVARFEGLALFRGSRRGAFEEPPRAVWQATPRLKYGQVLTCGDIDRDGDLDVWLGQYKAPYERGQMPRPYYDANDGHPAYLLVNDGRGEFTDATETSGLGNKRWRRSYSGSLADLDGDADLDLVVVSDFAGVDLYANDGRGQFQDMTSAWVTDPRAFGMAHAAADFNRDGRLDILMIGMNSPTADRLNQLGLERPGGADDRRMRARMTHGNRLYLGRQGGGFEQTDGTAAGSAHRAGSIARTGWSWGCGILDADNDGFPDVYIANGHESRASVQEYEPEFWLHDIHVGDSRDNPAVNTYFGAQFARTRGRGFSYGGYEKNRFYFNRGGTEFFEAGHLLGTALEADSRGVVAADLEGDGRMDLLVTTFEAWPVVRQTLRVFRNRLETPGRHWIGLRFRAQDGGVSPVGARVTLRCAGSVRVREIVTGDSYRAQHPPVAHFGLGSLTSVEEVEVRWVGGETITLIAPAVDRYHWVEGKK